MPDILKWDILLFEFIIVILVLRLMRACFFVCLFVVLDSALTPANITANINSVPMLNGSNFKS